MVLTPLHKHLLRRTFTQLVIYDESTLRLFRQRLGELNPGLIVMVETQPYRLMEILALVMSLLDKPAVLRPQLKSLQAREHISNEEFQQIGDALLWVLEQELGDAFTVQIQSAWQEFYRHIAHLTSEF